MRLWVVKEEQFNGYDCNGHWQTYVVIAPTSEAALALFPKVETFDSDPIVAELQIPMLSRMKKPRIIA